MAISGNSGGGIFADINITPLTDIFLVLLIIFMVSAAVAIESAAHVALPSPRSAAPHAPVSSVLVTLTNERHIFVNQNEVGLGGLQSALSMALNNSPQKLVVFKGDPKVILGDMVVVLDIAKRAGAQQLGVAVADDSSGTANSDGAVAPAPVR